MTSPNPKVILLCGARDNIENLQTSVFKAPSIPGLQGVKVHTLYYIHQGGVTPIWVLCRHICHKHSRSQEVVKDKFLGLGNEDKLQFKG